MFDQAFEFIQANLELAPYLIFALLLLAGLNIPVSEDVMLFTSAFMAIKNPHMLWPLFIAVFLGAYLSDLISYAWGRFLGPKLMKIKFFARNLPPKKMQKIQKFLENYGVLTLIIGRFIPFGVRNTMFMTAGMSRMNPYKFAFGDLIAAILTCSSYFYLYYTFGEKMIEIVKRFNIVIFAVFIIFLLFYFGRKYRSRKGVE